MPAGKTHISFQDPHKLPSAKVRRLTVLRSLGLYAADVRNRIFELLCSGVESWCRFDLREPVALALLIPKHFLLALQACVQI